MPCYVVLHHVGYGNPHYDLMLDPDGVSPLPTYRLRTWPPAPGDVPERIGDHRRDYLTYEGPVSNNRGSVTRVAKGTFETAADNKSITLDIGVKFPIQFAQ